MLLSSGERPAYKQLTEAVLAEHRPVLFRYALLQLRNYDLADDAVQETMLAAWQSASNFDGKAQLRTWLIGILKHKITDYWRLPTINPLKPVAAARWLKASAARANAAPLKCKT